MSPLFFPLEDREVVWNILCIVRLSTLCWIEEKKLRNQAVVRVPFCQRRGTSTCVVLLITSAVLPMAVIHKNTLFLYTSFKPPYMMQLLLSCFFFFFFPIKAKQGGFFPLVTSPSFLAPCLALPKVLGKKGKKYFLLFLTDSWVEGERGSFQFET